MFLFFLKKKTFLIIQQITINDRFKQAQRIHHYKLPHAVLATLYIIQRINLGHFYSIHKNFLYNANFAILLTFSNFLKIFISKSWIDHILFR